MSALRNPQSTIRNLLGLFFPARCRICGLLLEEITRVPVCRSCWEAVTPLPARGQCSICGLPVAGDLADNPGFRCGDCIKHPPYFDLARSYGAYGGALRELVHLLKYNGMTPLAKPLGERLAETAQSQSPPWAEVFIRCQAVVAMPLDPARRRSRGYNQAQMLARAAARRLQLPLLAGACIRVRATPPQAGLSRLQRQINVKGAFAADKRRVEGLVVLLVDDVMTTGATLNSCAQALLQAGAGEVLGLTVARALEHSDSLGGVV